MRTETEMLDVVLKTAETLQVTAVAMSGSRTDTKASKDEFQDYDVVYVVENLDELITDLSWLDQFGKRIIEQEVGLGQRRLYLMLFEDGNRIDLTLCPKQQIQEWVDSEAGFTVLEDPEHLFEPYSPNIERYWTNPASQTDFEKPAMSSGGCRPTLSKGFVGISSSTRPIISMAFVNKNS